MRVAIIGGGAAGFFCAINIKRERPDIDVTIYEKAKKPLLKVGVSGGGRCNLTNSFNDVKSLQKVYPRGSKVLKRAFKSFNHEDTYRWFEESGVRLVTQSDECVFPRSQSSGEIIDTFINQANSLGVNILLGCAVQLITKEDSGFNIKIKGGDTVFSDVVVATMGGFPKESQYTIFGKLPVEVVAPAPSLFALTIDDKSLNELSGAVMPNGSVALVGTKWRAEGALLITHWGVSGPAVLKLSSYAAYELQNIDYRANVAINWCGESSELAVCGELERIVTGNAKKLITSVTPYGLSGRVWLHIVERSGVSCDRRWGELGRKNINSLMRALIADEYLVSGKSTHSEEFVTAGGISLDSVNLSTLEAKECSNLFFAGEILDIDAITGGFNLQAAWSTAYVVAKNIIMR